ncbi:MAG TPA: sensor domain-containing protein [Gaiellaceae bacterium]|nr:sensor domain-containing protein [Gaiellaceae bacterium]
MSLIAPFRPWFQAQTYRDLLHLATAVPIAAVVLALLTAGWTAIGVLLITPLVVPVLLAYRGAVGLLARTEAALAHSLLGVATDPPTSSCGRGFWGHAKAVVADPSFWRQQGYLVLRMTLGFGFAVGELSLIAAAAGSITLPIWYRWSAPDITSSWHVDTLGRAFLFVPAGVAGLVAAGWLARLLGSASARLAASLLEGRRDVSASPEQRRRRRRRALGIHAGVAAGIVLTQVVVWALAGRGYFWPEWVILPLALVLAVHAWVELVEARRPARRLLAVHAGVTAALFLFVTLVWAVTGRGHFWPGWVLLGLGQPLAIHFAATRAGTRSRLRRRVERLESTRAEAVDEQDAELRRIERDLHDGAQARLVALGLNLGMAEQKFRSDPEAAEKLVAEARAGAAEALRELRDLARGIYPPVLSDRGLGAALETLVDRNGLETTVSVALDERPPARIETAAYFVAAEALANAAKHSGATRIQVRVGRRGDMLEVEVTDDGRGGADESGNGLVGLRRRVEALDGTFSVASPDGGPTTIRAELPCES